MTGAAVPFAPSGPPDGESAIATTGGEVRWLRAADGEVKAYTHIGQPVQDMRIPDAVLRITRHKGRGIETEHPAVFPVARDTHQKPCWGQREKKPTAIIRQAPSLSAPRKRAPLAPRFQPLAA